MLFFAKISMQLKCYFMQIFDSSLRRARAVAAVVAIAKWDIFSLFPHFPTHTLTFCAIKWLLLIKKFLGEWVNREEEGWRKREIKSSKLTWEIILEMSPGKYLFLLSLCVCVFSCTIVKSLFYFIENDRVECEAAGWLLWRELRTEDNTIKKQRHDFLYTVYLSLSNVSKACSWTRK